jgi:hypothetical protein
MSFSATQPCPIQRQLVKRVLSGLSGAHYHHHRDRLTVSTHGFVANFADRPSSPKLPATVATNQQAIIEFKGSHFERAVILWAVRWYVAYPISYRQLEEMMEEYGVEVDHATLNRWVLKYVPSLEQELQARGGSQLASG